ncbi:MAG: 4-(cytidine 5'-diphospho)-2-C-methyl-D-erythritol kinase [Leptospirales bacterium]
MNRLVIETPAKVNLFLRIQGKRPDGYHELLTEMVMISLTDRLDVRKKDLREGDSLTLSGRAVDGDLSENLVLRAVRLFREAVTSQQRSVETSSSAFHLDLEKRIPVGAGLGGGSSNAAGTLWAINCLEGFPLATEDLLKLAEGLGSDVPFFLGKSHAVASGRGEKLHPLPPFPVRTVLLWNPEISLSTAEVYRRLKAPSSIPLTDSETLHRINSLLSKDERQNDLEPVAVAMYPVVGMAKQILQSFGASEALMSGSGPSVFAFFEKSADAGYAQTEILARLGGWAGVFETLQASPIVS